MSRKSLPWSLPHFMNRQTLHQLELLQNDEIIPIPPEQRLRLVSAVAELLVAEAVREVTDDEH
jgi:hypothetical protein